MDRSTGNTINITESTLVFNDLKRHHSSWGSEPTSSATPWELPSRSPQPVRKVNSRIIIDENSDSDSCSDDIDVDYNPATSSQETGDEEPLEEISISESEDDCLISDEEEEGKAQPISEEVNLVDYCVHLRCKYCGVLGIYDDEEIVYCELCDRFACPDCVSKGTVIKGFFFDNKKESLVFYCADEKHDEVAIAIKDVLPCMRDEEGCGVVSISESLRNSIFRSSSAPVQKKL